MLADVAGFNRRLSAIVRLIADKLSIFHLNFGDIPAISFVVRRQNTRCF